MRYHWSPFRRRRKHAASRVTTANHFPNRGSSSILHSSSILSDIFQRYADEDGKMSCEAFEEFWKAEQHEEDRTGSIFRSFENRDVARKRLSFEDFVEILISDGNMARDTKRWKSLDEMQKPMSDYYIASSHNTYLADISQFRGYACTEGITKALQLGARLIELDCFDGRDGNPIVTHKNTMIVPVSFEQCVLAIAKFRELNPGRAGPLIITLENYCSLVQQQQMALILKKAFKQDLLIDEDTAIATNRRWPSICEIQGKIILRDKPWGKIRRINMLHKVAPDGSGTPSAKSIQRRHERKKELLDVVFMKNYKLLWKESCGFSLEASAGTPFRNPSCSINTNKLAGYFKDSRTAKALRLFSRDTLVRVYPKLTSKTLYSSNVNPLPAWSLGCQMVAMNYQRFDEVLWVYQGFFRSNYSCGFVERSSRLSSGTDDARGEAHLRVTIIAALPSPKQAQDLGKFDALFIEVTAFLPSGGKLRRRSKPIGNASLLWEENLYFHLGFNLPRDLTMILFVAKDRRGKALCQAAIPLGELKSGFRVIKMYSTTGSSPQAPYNLFCRIEH